MHSECTCKQWIEYSLFKKIKEFSWDKGDVALAMMDVLLAFVQNKKLNALWHMEWKSLHNLMLERTKKKQKRKFFMVDFFL